MKTLSVLSGDPGRTNDPFGITGLKGTWPEKKIYVLYAKQFKKESYDTVAKHFLKLGEKVNPDMMILEKNFDYENIHPVFSKYKLDIKYVTTSANLTEKTRSKGWAVDKNFMIGWLQKQHGSHSILYPNILSADMQELINQRIEMVGITAPSGHTSYKRQRGRHDDLFLAKLIGCNAIRIWWDINE